LKAGGISVIKEVVVAIPGLTLIGETINDSVPGTKELFDRGDLEGIKQLAIEQVAGGARAIDVNVGRRGPELMATAVARIQAGVAVPLSIDSPDLTYLRAGLRAYDPVRGGGKATLNSLSALRTEGLELAREKPCRVILLITERKGGGGESKPCKTAREEYDTARELFGRAAACGFAPHDIIFDPGITPLGADTEGRLRRTIETLRLLHDDPTFRGCHASVGLSNFTVMLPKKRPNGKAIRSTLESAFLTLAMPLGLDTIIGSVKRQYELLPDNDDAVVCLKDILLLEGFEAIARLDRYCRG
jgi:cobalamin-dependent methionine synthase I